MVSTSVTMAMLFALLAILPTPHLAISLGTCKTLDNAENLDVSEFFNGTWYVTYEIGDSILSGVDCPVKLYVENDNGTISESTYYYDNTTLTWEVSGITGTLDVEVDSETGAVENIDYKVLGLDGLQLSDTTLIVVEVTDERAVLYTCSQTLLLKTEKIWVLSRSLSTDDDDSSEDSSTVALDLLNLLGLDISLSDLIGELDNTSENCPATGPVL